MADGRSGGLPSREAMEPGEIAAFRERHGLTQEQLATLVGVSRNTVWRWEHGDRLVYSPRMLRLALDSLDGIIECAGTSPSGILVVPAKEE